MRPRFHLPEIDTTRRGVLNADEVQHLTRVLRLGAGAEIDVFDGRGGMFRARVVDVSRAGAAVEVLEAVPAAAEPAVRVTLVMSVLKGDRMDEVVRDAVMMGVAAVQPVVAARSEVTLAALERGRRRDRWQRVAVAALKQCGRAFLPVVRTPMELPAWVDHAPDELVIALTEPSAGPAAGLRDLPPAGAACLLVGPEGGWASEELAQFRASGVRAVSLGGRTLRADAAPLVAMAALFEAWQAW